MAPALVLNRSFVPLPHYALLGVRRTASQAELFAGYTRALVRANRDRDADGTVAVVQAYQVLSNPGRRAIYDATGQSWPPERAERVVGQGSGSDKACVARQGDGLAARVGVDLAEHVAHVVAHGLEAQHEVIGDVRVAVALRHQP